MSQAVSSSAGVNKSGVSEEEEVGVEDEKEKALLKKAPKNYLPKEI